jgi:hypothetical protein
VNHKFANFTRLLSVTLSVTIFFILTVFVISGFAGNDKSCKVLFPGKPEMIAGCYKISQSYPLTKSIHGVDGILQLLQDSRLTKDAYDRQNGTGFNNYVYTTKENGDFSVFAENPPLGTVLRVLTKEGQFLRIAESHTYDIVPVAWLEEVILSGSDNPYYLLTLDESTGMGSYTGPTTYFYKVVNGRLKSIDYLDQNSGKRKQLVLMRSLKTDWKFVDSTDGKLKDILHIACRPNPEHASNEEVEFLIYYDRFHFNGKEWVKFQKIEKGFWESEDGNIPPLSQFPAVP